MRKANLVITSVLVALAVGAWGFTAYKAWLQWTVPPVYMVMAILFTACAVVGWILLNVADLRRDGFTRCRKCGHILRGLSEPRCPECGTAI